MTKAKRGAAATALLLLPFLVTPTAFAQGAARTLEVAGTGEARATPDVAYLGFEVETHAPGAEQAASKNAALARNPVRTLKDRLAGKGAVTTGSYSLRPEYSEPAPRVKARLVGYTAENVISVETGELALAGPLIDSAVAAGANRINYLNFGLRDDTKARNEAIANASAQAEAQARALAASLGLKLKRVIKASTLPPTRPIVPAQAMALGAPMTTVPTPIEPGQITVTATVSLIYEIE